MNNNAYRLGLMGGTFDPIHYGHLVTAEQARTQFALNKVIFVPTGKPPHKKYSVTEAEHRYQMTLLATASNPYFEVSRFEIDSVGYSYTIDTISAFKKMFSEGTEIFFITGADAILEILTWKRVEDLMKETRFIAATRPGFNLADLELKLATLPFADKKMIDFMEIPALSISSTDIRLRVNRGSSIKYLLPESVEDYIYKNHLYL